MSDLGVDVSAAARAEYVRRFAKAETLAQTDQFTHDIADSLHNWQRIAWLLDPAGRTDEPALLIAVGELEAMAAEARNCRDIWISRHQKAPEDSSISARARSLSHITRTIEIRMNSARRLARPESLERKI